MIGKCREFPHILLLFPHSLVLQVSCVSVLSCVISFVKSDALTLLFAKIIVHIRAHSWCCTPYGFGQVCDDLYLPS